MEKWILNVETNCADSAREKEFNEWYDKVHLPDILHIPEVVRASRYECADPSEGQAKFLAIYEIETKDLGETMAALGERLEAITREGRMSDLCILVGTRMYKQITAPVQKRKAK
ncbi:MAG: hypothetical protein FJ012_00930 [Chloroflexi bacterium]|nr:hypothetical protein [Chloroflexota bacterium]